MRFILATLIFFLGVLFGMMAFWPTDALAGVWIWFMRAGLFILGWSFIAIVIVFFVWPGAANDQS
jgi:hypothetical protein